MRDITSGLAGLVLALGLGGCGRFDSPVTPVTPSHVPPQEVIRPPALGSLFPSGYTLRGVSLSGVVYELTPSGRRPISGAMVYCEMCGEQTHTLAAADDKGFYHFSGDLASGGGVWVAHGVFTPILVYSVNQVYEDPPGLPPIGHGPGWRYVLIDGNTRLDIELVRRAVATP